MRKYQEVDEAKRSRWCMLEPHIPSEERKVKAETKVWRDFPSPLKSAGITINGHPVLVDRRGRAVFEGGRRVDCFVCREFLAEGKFIVVSRRGNKEKPICFECCREVYKASIAMLKP